MKLSDFMTAVGEPSPEYKGSVTNDNMVLAIGITGVEESEKDYEVLATNIAGVDSQMNPTTEDKTYLYVGTSTTKTGTQRSFAVSGDRYVGDAAQDFIFSNKIKYGIGQGVVVPYVYINTLNGKGEKGKVSIIVNSDGGGNAGESSAISVDLKSTGVLPEEYTYSAEV